MAKVKTFPCPECRVMIPLDSTFCSVCGVKIEPVIPEQPSAQKNNFCADCGSLLPHNAAFCSSCGAKNPTHISTNNTETIVTPTNGKKEIFGGIFKKKNRADNEADTQNNNSPQNKSAINAMFENSEGGDGYYDDDDDFDDDDDDDERPPLKRPSREFNKKSKKPSKKIKGDSDASDEQLIAAQNGAVLEFLPDDAVDTKIEPEVDKPKIKKNLKLKRLIETGYDNYDDQSETQLDKPVSNVQQKEETTHSPLPIEQSHSAPKTLPMPKNMAALVANADTNNKDNKETVMAPEAVTDTKTIVGLKKRDKPIESSVEDMNGKQIRKSELGSRVPTDDELVDSFKDEFSEEINSEAEEEAYEYYDYAPKHTKLKAILVFVSLIIFFLGGAASVFFYTRSQYPMKNYDIVHSAVEICISDVVNQNGKNNFRAYDIYLKDIGSTTEVLVFGAILSGVTEYTPSYYRVTLSKDTKIAPIVYRPFSQDIYDRLMEDGDAKSVAKAQEMNAFYQTFLAYKNEIAEGRGNWVHENPSFADANINIERADKKPLLTIF